MKNQNEVIQEIQVKEETKMEGRKQEVMNKLTALRSTHYGKKEGLDEMLKLRSQMAWQMLGRDHGRQCQYYDIINCVRDFRFHNKQISQTIVPRFVKKCYVMHDRIGAEMSGNKGEEIASYALDNIKTDHLVLRNVELDDNGKKTEIDAVVITKYGIFILEIKNSTVDITIDEKGNYYRITKNGIKMLDKNIGVQCNNRKTVLERVIAKSNFADILKTKEIQELVVFTNSNIKVENNYPYIKDCYLSTLPHIIDEFRGEEILSRRNMSNLAIYIQAREKHSEYLPVEFNIENFKDDFATLLITMEEEKEKYPRDYDKESLIYKLRDLADWMLGGKKHRVYFRKVA